MKAYSIFDDFGLEPIKLLTDIGIDLTVHPLGKPRPNLEEMKAILENYDCVIIGTSQKITEDMFENVTKPRIIATASVGLDHIRVPNEKRELVKIINTPKANAQSVAEYTIGCALSCCKRLSEAGTLYAMGRDNKALSRKPEDLFGKTIGVIGAGNISVKIMEYASMMGMNVVYWTAHPENHSFNSQYVYMPLNEMVATADVISVNIPNSIGTQNLVSRELVQKMKSTCIFISVSRLASIDITALIERAQIENNFYVNVDIDVDDAVVEAIKGKKNVYVTPHIGGGTIETRKRMFRELAEQIVKYLE